MNSPEFFDCDYAQKLLETECEDMPSEFIVDSTAWAQDSGVYLARWISKDMSRGGVTGIWFNEVEDGRTVSAYKILNEKDIRDQIEYGGRLMVLDKIGDFMFESMNLF